MTSPQATTWGAGRFELRPAERQLFVDGRPAKLGARAFDVLQALIERHERMVSKDELMGLVWPSLVVEENNLQVHISALRKLLGPQAIATIPGRGYQFTLLFDSAPEAAGLAQQMVEPRRAPQLGLGPPTDLARPEQVSPLQHPGIAVDFPPLTSPATHPNNLPRQLTSFIGRKKEIAAIEALLARTRLLTLIGSGGCGKTRLSLQVAANSFEQFPDGAWFMELAPLADSSLVPQTVATALGVKEEPGKQLTQTLSEHLKHKRLLLLVDNCEHLLDACAKVADTLVRQCPGLKILASSRQALGTAGEQTYRVPSLSLPDRNVVPTPQALSQYESVRLFIDRALLVRADFQLTDNNAPALASLCRHLDGIPLAIELAAARVRSLSVEEIDCKLDQRFRLLTGGPRMALPRHQTLLSLIDWSYDLLHEPEKLLLQRLSVFAGGWTLPAAEEVCAGQGVADWEILDLLTMLCDKSLVVAEQLEGHSRYRLLETVRQYAREKLVESAGEAAVLNRHSNYFLALVEETEPELDGTEQAEWLRRLEEEHENLLASLESCLADAGSRGGLRLCGALGDFWVMQGHLSEGREWYERVLSKAGNEERTPERAKVLNAAGALALYQGDFPAAREWYEESLAIARQLGDRRGIAAALSGLGLLALSLGDFSSAQTQNEESLAIARELGDRRGVAASFGNLGAVALSQGDFLAAQPLLDESLSFARKFGDRWNMGLILYRLGLVAGFRGDYPAARMLLQESLAIRREFGDRGGAAGALSGLGMVAYDQGDHLASGALYRESLVMRRALGDRSAIAISLEGMAEVVAALGGAIRAARIWGATERLRTDIGAPLRPAWRRHCDRSVAAARTALGDDGAFDRAWQEGRALTLEQAMDLALDATGEQR